MGVFMMERDLAGISMDALAGAQAAAIAQTEGTHAICARSSLLRMAAVFVCSRRPTRRRLNRRIAPQLRVQRDAAIPLSVLTGGRKVVASNRKVIARRARLLIPSERRGEIDLF